jgi:hypothetical protein
MVPSARCNFHRCYLSTAFVLRCYAIMKINFFRYVKIFHRVDVTVSRKYDMKFKIGLCVLLSLLCLLCLPSSSKCAEITKLDTTVKDNHIYISTAVSLDKKHIEELKHGIKKEFRFYIDIFKMWNIWPDEFITGTLYVRTIQCDPVKTEYIATSSNGQAMIEKRFTSFESMLQWALNIHNLDITIPQDLEPGSYFIRVIVVSKIRKLPPVLRDLLIFIPENEFKIKKDSPVFYIGTAK